MAGVAGYILGCISKLRGPRDVDEFVLREQKRGYTEFDVSTRCYADSCGSSICYGVEVAIRSDGGRFVADRIPSFLGSIVGGLPFDSGLISCSFQGIDAEADNRAMQRAEEIVAELKENYSDIRVLFTGKEF